MTATTERPPWAAWWTENYGEAAITQEQEQLAIATALAFRAGWKAAQDRVADAERDLAKAWYEGWCAGERWGYWVEREDPINHRDVSMSANPYGDYTPPENERESNWPIDA